MTTLIIARHGNTFEEGEISRRVGCRTDLRLTARGEDQARALGNYLIENNLVPDLVYAGRLLRTQQTAKIVRETTKCNSLLQTSAIFDEIDYGPDENKTEAEVASRVGEAAIQAWETDGMPPPGWKVSIETLENNWKIFAARLVKDHGGKTVLVVTSNGIARFAPVVTGDVAGFRARHSLKLATGAAGILTHGTGGWTVKGWNVKP